MRHKNEALMKFKLFKQMVSRMKSNMWIKILRIDDGGKYLSKNFKEFCQQHGVHWQHTQARTLQQNEVAKWMNRSLLEKARSLMLEANVSKFLWTKGVNTTTYLYNCSLTKSNLGVTPEESYSRKKPDLSHLHIFGCTAFVHIVKEDKNK